MGEEMRREVAGVTGAVTTGVGQPGSSFPLGGDNDKSGVRLKLAQQGGGTEWRTMAKELAERFSTTMSIRAAEMLLEKKGDYAKAFQTLASVNTSDPYLNARTHEVRGEIYSAASLAQTPERLGDTERKDFGNKSLEERVAAKDEYKKYLESDAVINLPRNQTLGQSPEEWAKVAHANISYAKLIVTSQKDFRSYYQRLDNNVKNQVRAEVFEALNKAERITKSLQRLKGMQETVEALGASLCQAGRLKAFVNK